ncbi:MAG TPA: ACT domain-containing protein [Lysobacter sp.]|jgi:acetolactate synthase II small subunit
MRYRLDLLLRPIEGALLRTIGLAERRGFAPLAIEGAPVDGQWRLQLIVDGTRSPETLQRLMEKNYDCLAVEITPCP